MEPMNCRSAKPLLSRYADGELSPVEAKGVREHLIDCPRCRGVVSEVASIRRFFEDGAGAALRAPAGFADRVAAAALAGPREEGSTRSTVRFTRRIAAIAAAIALLAAGGILVRSGAFDRGPASLQAQEEDPVVKRIRERFERGRGAPPAVARHAKGSDGPR
jgi:anti-sigma factor RsiW